MNKLPLTIELLNKIENNIENAGRNIYYAMSFLENNSPARANLEIALDELGIKSPREVGLSNSVLEKKK